MVIEFVEPADPEALPGSPAEALPGAPAETIGGDEPIGRLRPRPQSPAVAGVLFLIAAAVLPVIAPFWNVFVETVSSGGQRQGFAIDGWGRAHRTVGAAFGFPPGTHDARYGIVLCCCAGAFLVTALAVLAARLRRGTLRALGGAAAAALGLSGVLAGTAATIWLTVEARADSVRAAARQDGQGPFGDVHTQVGVGAAFWLAAAAAVAGLLAALGCWWLSARDLT
jgi:hypothetical protein